MDYDFRTYQRISMSNLLSPAQPNLVPEILSRVSARTRSLSRSVDEPVHHSRPAIDAELPR